MKRELSLDNHGKVEPKKNIVCPIVTTIKLIEKKWTLLIIRELSHGNARFCRLQKEMDNLNPRTLSARLQELENEGIIYRHVKSETPLWVEYELTEKGKDLLSVLEAMGTWSEKWAK